MYAFSSGSTTLSESWAPHHKIFPPTVGTSASPDSTNFQIFLDTLQPPLFLTFPGSSFYRFPIHGSFYKMTM